MSEVVDHLAELTGFRDRDVLDVTLVSAFRDLLRPDSVTIYRTVGDAGNCRWLTRARLRAHESTPSADSIWADLEELPALDALPSHQHSLQQQRAVLVESAAGAVSLFPLSGDGEAGGVLEICTPSALTPAQSRMVSSILRIYRNFEGLLDYSERDTLTGLLNRKTFDGSFLRVAAQGADSIQQPEGERTDQRENCEPATAWLGVVDIDHFKRVNDNHGHLIGDEVLLLVAGLMRASFRFQDQLYRFGGDSRRFLGLVREALTSLLRHHVQQVDAGRTHRRDVAQHAHHLFHVAFAGIGD